MTIQYMYVHVHYFYNNIIIGGQSVLHSFKIHWIYYNYGSEFWTDGQWNTAEL